MLNFDLNFHSYKIQVVQELTENYLAIRCSCSEKNLRFICSKPSAVIMTSNEVHFQLCGTVNKQNFRYSAEHNPRELHQKPCIRNGLRCGARLEIAAFGALFL